MFKKFKNMPAELKASIAFFFASLVTKGISYIVTPIYTQILEPEVYGQASIFMTWLETFGILAMFCLSYGVFNNGMLDYPDKRDEYSFSMLVLSNIITGLFTVIILLLYPLIKEYIGLDLALLILMCVMFIFQPAYTFWSTRQRYELKYRWTVLWTIISAFASPVVAIICILTTDGNDLYARLFGAEVSLIIIYIGFYIYLAIKSKFKVNVGYWKAAILFNVPLIPHYLSTYLLGNSNKLLISNIIGDAAVAYYSIAQSVASMAMIVWTAINSSLIPYTYRKCREKKYSDISGVVCPILALFATVSVIIILLAPEVVAILGTADYQAAIYAIPPIVGGVFFQVHYFIYANVVYYYKKPKYVMIASISSVIFNFVIGYFLITHFGYLAAGYSTLICYILQASIDYFAMRKVVGENVYNMKLIGAMSLLIVVVSVLGNFLYMNSIVRYVIIGVILLGILIIHKKIIALVKSMREK